MYHITARGSKTSLRLHLPLLTQVTLSHFLFTIQDCSNHSYLGNSQYTILALLLAEYKSKTHITTNNYKHYQKPQIKKQETGMFNIEFNHFFKEYILPILNNPLHGQMQLIISLIRSIEVPCTKAIGHEFKSENQPLQKKKQGRRFLPITSSRPRKQSREFVQVYLRFFLMQVMIYIVKKIIDSFKYCQKDHRQF